MPTLAVHAPKKCSKEHAGQVPTLAMHATPMRADGNGGIRADGDGGSDRWRWRQLSECLARCTPLTDSADRSIHCQQRQGTHFTWDMGGPMYRARLYRARLYRARLYVSSFRARLYVSSCIERDCMCPDGTWEGPHFTCDIGEQAALPATFPGQLI